MFDKLAHHYKIDTNVSLQHMPSRHDLTQLTMQQSSNAFCILVFGMKESGDEMCIRDSSGTILFTGNSDADLSLPVYAVRQKSTKLFAGTTTN